MASVSDGAGSHAGTAIVRVIGTQATVLTFLLFNCAVDGLSVSTFGVEESALPGIAGSVDSGAVTEYSSADPSINDGAGSGGTTLDGDNDVRVVVSITFCGIAGSPVGAHSRARNEARLWPV